MNKKTLLKSELDHFAGNLYYAFTCLRYAHQMATTKFDGETNVLHESEHLRFFAKILNRTFYLEIAKIVIDNKGNLNLHKTLRKLKPGGYFSSIKCEESLISEMETILETQKEVINRIQIVRNKEIAHSELSIFQNSKSIDINEITLSFEECSSIFNSAAQILNRVSESIFNTSYHLQFTMFMYHRRSFHQLLNDIHTVLKVRRNTTPEIISNNVV
jgi:ribosomal protein S6